MQIGNRYRCYPTTAQENILRRWIGCQRFIYNAKVGEDRYYRAFARRFVENAGRHAPVDQEYARFIGEDTAWLREVPSQILRNGSSKWRGAYSRFFKGISGRPKIKDRHGKQSVWITSELFQFSVTKTGIALNIGTKKFPFGELRYVMHRGHDIPASIHISHHGRRWYVSFTTEDEQSERTEHEIADWLATFDRHKLSKHTIGIDRGVAIPCATSDAGDFHFRRVERKRISKRAKQRKRAQRVVARRQQGSRRREIAKAWVSTLHRRDADLRRDFAHQTSRKLVDDPNAILFVFEDLKIKSMTARARGCGVRQKAGLNRSILGSAWGQTKIFLTHKAQKAHKLVISVAPHYSSQECRICGHTSPDNRTSQSLFVCQECGHAENADCHAAHVIKARGVNTVLAGWSPKAKSCTKFTRGRRAAGEVLLEEQEPAIAKASAYARGEHVSRRSEKPSAQRSRSREKPQLQRETLSYGMLHTVD